MEPYKNISLFLENEKQNDLPRKFGLKDVSASPVQKLTMKGGDKSVYLP